MDQFRGAFNSFTQGNNQNQQPHGQGQPPQGNASHEQQSGGMGGFMNSINSFANKPQNQSQQPQGEGAHQQQSGGFGGMFSGFTNKLNAAAGGGPESEKNEDYLDKGVDFVQERFLGQGPQNNESAVEQAKDEQISDFIRNKYKSATGKDFFVKDKDTAFDKADR